LPLVLSFIAPLRWRLHLFRQTGTTVPICYMRASFLTAGVR
jgi:hypothetical protein